MARSATAWTHRGQPHFACFALVALVGSVGFIAGAPGTAHAKSQPLLGVEARFAAGATFGGGDHSSGWKVAPLTLSLLAEYAVIERPRVSLYGQVIYEGLKRAGFGLGGGVRLHPSDSGLRVGAGIVAMLTSYTHGGVSASAGQCFRWSWLRACADLEAAVFFFGTDLPLNGVDAQIRLALAVGFDAL